MRINFGEFRQKAYKGIAVLFVKRVFVQVIFTTTNIFLARLLFPEDFGIYAVVGFCGALFIVFSDLGLGPSLVRKTKKVTLLDLQTAYTSQLILSLLIIATLFISAGKIADFFGIGQDGVNLIRIYSLFFLFGPFKTTSGAILERNLEYSKVVIAEVLEVAFGAGVTIILASLGYGPFSFVFGAVFGHFVGGSTYFMFYPWKIRLKIISRNFWSLSKFGFPWQMNNILSLFYGPVILLYLGKSVGAESLGFFQFAASLSVFPLAFSDIINRVIFPLGSRVERNTLFFKRVVEHSVSLISATTLPMASIGFALAPQIIHFVYTDRWLAALPSLYLGFVQMCVIAYSGVFSQLLLARGHANVVRNMSVVWAILTWVLAPFFINRFNFVGMNIASLLVSFSGFWLFFSLKKEVDFSWQKAFLPYFLSAILAGVAAYVLEKIFAGTLFGTIAAGLSGLVIYLCLIIILARKSLEEILRSVVPSTYNE